MRFITGIAFIAFYIVPLISAKIAIFTDIAAVLDCPGCAETNWIPIAVSTAG